MIEGKDFEGDGFDVLQAIIPETSLRNIVKSTKTVRIVTLLAVRPSLDVL
jgi:hypothetical protein